MPSLLPEQTLQMSQLTWRAACARVAGAISLANQPDALDAARDAISETLEDWDSRHDWRFTQIVAPDITISGGDSTFDLPTTFKKPYVAYLSGSRQPLFFIERGNWHRMFPGLTSQSVPGFYTLYNEASTGKGDLFATASSDDTLNLLYYRSMKYTDDDDATLDILSRWSGYILAGARMRLVASKIANDKALFWEKRYEMGIREAKKDDRRMPDQFLSFSGPASMTAPPYWNNPNSTWQSVYGDSY